jgi:uncharacterized membrane protein
MPPPLLTTRSDSRIAPVDAARGVAMLLVFLSHIKQHFEVSAPELHDVLLAVTRIATPTFLLLSGFVIRHLQRTDPRGDTSMMLVDRALFLLIVARGLIGLADLPDFGVTRWSLGRALVTDAVGVALLVAVLVRHAPAYVLAALGLVLCVSSWVIAITVSPDPEWARLAGSVLFQLRSADHPAIDAPLVSYVGVFLLGMALSSKLEQPLGSRDYGGVSRKLLWIGGCAVGVALAGVLVWHFGKGYVAAWLGDADTAALVRETLDPRGKRPPSVGYLLFYSGLGLLVLAVFFRARPAWLVPPALRWTAVIGRASLMCFVVQDWLFFLLPDLLGLDAIQSVPFWLAYFAACVLVLYTLARLWTEVRGNRFLTVGLRALWRRPARVSKLRTRFFGR